MRQPKKAPKKFVMGVNNKSIKMQANNAENDIVKVFQTPNSGSVQGLKTDLFVGNACIDVKTALKAKQIIVSEDMLNKLLDDALEVNKEPVLLLYFPNSNLRQKKWVIRPLMEE